MKDLKYWLWLSGITGVGNRTIASLVQYYGTAEAVYQSTGRELEACGLLEKKIIDRLLTCRDIEMVNRYLIKMKEKSIKVYTINDEAYPENLKNIYDPPCILYVKGSLTEADKSAVAVVGSRKGSDYGMRTAEKFGSMLAENGVTVVSGMALGIDSAAHRGALKGRGRTIAVLGCGLGNIYPKNHYNLSCEILKHGALVSEYPFEVEARPAYFPARNRIISGLSLGVLVVEAGQKSGSLITSDFALEQGREVFAIPGNIHSPGSKGTHWLIKNGAKLVDCLEDILEELNIPLILSRDKYIINNEETGLTAEEGLILCCMQQHGRSIDAIIQDTGLPAGRVMSCLTIMELKGIILQNEGCFFIAQGDIY